VCGRGNQHLTLQQLEYFRTLSKVLHYTNAAEILHISQPSLSYSIAELERELGCKLFIKENKKIQLSWEGEVFLVYVEKALDILDEGIKKIASLQKSADLGVRLGFFHSISSKFIPNLVSSYYKETGDSHLQFYFTLNKHQSLIEALKKEDIDLAICPNADFDPDISYSKIGTQKLFLVTKDPNIYNERKVSLNFINKKPFIALDKQSGLRLYLEKVFRENDIHPNYVCEAKECTTVLTYVSLGLGYSIVPKSNELEDENLYYVEIINPVCERDIFLAWKNGISMPEPVRNVRDYILNRKNLSL